MSAALGQLKCKRLIALHLRSTAQKGSKGLERDVKKTAQCAVFSPRRVNRVSGAKKAYKTPAPVEGCGASPIDRTNRKDDITIVFFSFSAKNDAALPLISKNSFQSHPNPNRHRLSRLNYCVFIKNVH